MHIRIYRFSITVFILFFSISVFLNAYSEQVTEKKVNKRQEAFNRNALKKGFPKNMLATSAKIDSSGKTYIVLYWGSQDGAVGYNLYRKKKGASSYSPIPINGKKLIKTAADCNQLKAVIPVDSKAWKLMESAFDVYPVRKETGLKLSNDSHLKITSGTVMGDEESALPHISSGISNKSGDLVRKEMRLCSIFNQGLTPHQEEVFDMLARLNLKCRRARGLAFKDTNVEANQEYVYELRLVNSQGHEEIVEKDLQIRAGHYILPAAPQDLTVTAGDSKVLCLWNSSVGGCTYDISRAVSESGPYHIMNSKPISFNIENDIEGNALENPTPGFMDYQRWDEEGMPAKHKVEGRSISGPKNGQTYYYRVASRDILGRRGPWSSPGQATPRDSTPPTVPGNFRVDVSTNTPSLILSWEKVTRDIKGHCELDNSQKYLIYRSDTLEKLEDIKSLKQYKIASVTANPTDTGNMQLTWKDSDLKLVQENGEKDFFYRVRCKDANDNIGAPSAVISARVPDRKPPGPTEVTGSKGFENHIDIYWLPNQESDLAGYQIYRSICHRGRPYQPKRKIRPIKDKEAMEIELPCDYVLIGQVLLEDAQEMFEAAGKITFSDDSVPEGSPICYSYWVRAFDESRNLYPGDKNCPKDGEYICQKLYEQTPPPAPVITGLKARSNSVIIKWISSPVQDLYCFHVYRSLKEKDTNEPPEFIACVLIDNTCSEEKWPGMEPKCEDIPAEPDPVSYGGSFTDKNLEPKKEYWYRVSALDWLGNESKDGNILEIPAISTFTYSNKLPKKPGLLAPAGITGEGGSSIIRWKPDYDPEKFIGFIVFRKPEAGGTYRQISPIVRGNEFHDKTAFEGKTYWYRVQSIDKSGKLSKPSPALKY